MRVKTFQRGLYHVLYDFGRWTSIHGLPHVALADDIITATFWIVVVIVSTFILVMLVANSIRKYFSYPVTMTQRSIITPQDFPVITICNGSPWKRSGAPGTPLQGLIEAYEAGASNDTYGFAAPFDMAESLRATRWTRFMFEDLQALDQKRSHNLGYRLNDMLIDCQYNQRPCKLNETVTFYDPYNGLCHMLNPNMTWLTSRAGPYNGMRISLKSPQAAYLPWIQTAGIIYFVHGTNETPFQDAFGYFAQVGKCTSVGIKGLKRIKLTHPYSDCSDDGNGASNYYDNAYAERVEACLRSCIQDNITATCGCYDPQYNFPPNISVPSCYKMNDTNAAMDCADSIINVALEDSESFSIEQCNCPYDCDQSFYLIAMSQAKWVPPSHIPPECANQSISSPLWSTSDECIAWYKENTIMLELYFERPYYQSNLEASAYSWTDALADVGGQLGLWLGMSVISLVELGMLAGVAIAFVFLQPKNVNIKGYDYWKEFNNQIDAKGSDLYKADAKEDPLPPKIIHSDDLKSSYSDIGHTGQEMP